MAMTVGVGLMSHHQEPSRVKGPAAKLMVWRWVRCVPCCLLCCCRYESSNDDQQKFIQNLALFFTGFFKVGTQGGAAAGVCV